MWGFATLENSGAALGSSRGEVPGPGPCLHYGWRLRAQRAHVPHVSGCADSILHGFGRVGGRADNQLAAKSTGIQTHTYAHAYLFNSSLGPVTSRSEWALSESPVGGIFRD